MLPQMLPRTRPDAGALVATSAERGEGTPLVMKRSAVRVRSEALGLRRDFPALPSFGAARQRREGWTPVVTVAASGHRMRNECGIAFAGTGVPTPGPASCARGGDRRWLRRRATAGLFQHSDASAGKEHRAPGTDASSGRARGSIDPIGLRATLLGSASRRATATRRHGLSASHVQGWPASGWCSVRQLPRSRFRRRWRAPRAGLGPHGFPRSAARWS